MNVGTVSEENPRVSVAHSGDDFGMEAWMASLLQ